MPDVDDTLAQQTTADTPLPQTNYLTYSWLNWTLTYFPWILIVFVFVNHFFINNLFSHEFKGAKVDEIQLTGLAVAAVGFAVLHTLLQKAATMLNDLWLRGVFKADDRDRLVQFSNAIAALANHRWWQFAILLFLVGIIAASTVYRCDPDSTQGIELITCHWTSGMRTTKAIVELITTILLSPFVWRALVVAWSISKIGRLFDLNVIWSHPDRSGGFLPVGAICFWLAMIVAIPATFLGTWLIFCQSGTNCSHIGDLEQRLNVFEHVLLLIIILALISFVWPLWSIHKAMEKEKRELERTELSTISHNIDLIAKMLVVNAEKITHLNEEDTQKLLAENKILESKLTVLQETYSALNGLPVWPFDKQTLIKLVSAQGIPILGLTGIGSDLLDLLNSLLSLGKTP